MKMSHVRWNVFDRFTKVCLSLTELDQWLYCASFLVVQSMDAHTIALFWYICMCSKHLLHAVKEFQKLVEQAHPKSLVVVDYYRTACGACKYILPGFVKLCKRSGSHDAPVIFLKHNVIDE